MATLPDFATLSSIAREMHTGYERMVQIQMTAYPDSWSDAEKRDAAAFDLALRADGGLMLEARGL